MGLSAGKSNSKNFADAHEKLLPSLPIKYDQVCSGEKWSIFRFNVDYGEEWPIARVLPPAI